MKPEISIDGDLAYIPLTKGYVATVSACDLPKLDGRNWRTMIVKRNNGADIKAIYAIATGYENGKPRNIYMHRLLLEAPPGLFVDHRDSDGLNNTRENLRLATKHQNAWNKGPHVNTPTKSGLKGAFWIQSARKWRSAIRVLGVLHDLGNFDTAQDAADAYAKKASELHGEFWRAS